MSIPPQYFFSQEDQMFPVYCTDCRAHIPKIISNQNGGLCPTCLAKTTLQFQQRVVSQMQAQAQAQTAQKAQQQALFDKNTGLGKCPQCQSTNIVQFDNKVENQGQANAFGITGLVCIAVGAITFCVGGFLLVGLGIFFLLGATISSFQKQKINTSRQCEHCGYRWQV